MPGSSPSIRLPQDPQLTISAVRGLHPHRAPGGSLPPAAGSSRPPSGKEGPAIEHLLRRVLFRRRVLPVGRAPRSIPALTGRTVKVGGRYSLGWVNPRARGGLFVHPNPLHMPVNPRARGADSENHSPLRAAAGQSPRAGRTYPYTSRRTPLWVNPRARGADGHRFGDLHVTRGQSPRAGRTLSPSISHQHDIAQI